MYMYVQCLIAVLYCGPCVYMVSLYYCIVSSVLPTTKRNDIVLLIDQWFHISHSEWLAAMDCLYASIISIHFDHTHIQLRDV